jgi:hypothetical protein
MSRPSRVSCIVPEGNECWPKGQYRSAIFDAIVVMPGVKDLMKAVAMFRLNGSIIGRSRVVIAAVSTTPLFTKFGKASREERDETLDQAAVTDCNVSIVGLDVCWRAKKCRERDPMVW